MKSLYRRVGRAREPAVVAELPAAEVRPKRVVATESKMLCFPSSDECTEDHDGAMSGAAPFLTACIETMPEKASSSALRVR
jgi:hypothetical protein